MSGLPADDESPPTFIGREDGALTWTRDQAIREDRSIPPRNILRRLPLARLLLLCADSWSRSGCLRPRSPWPSAAVPRHPPSRSPRPSTTRSARARCEGVSANIDLHQPPARRREPRPAAPAATGGLAFSPLIRGCLRPAVDLQRRSRAHRAAGRTGRHADPLRRAHPSRSTTLPSNTLYRYTPPAGESSTGTGSPAGQGAGEHSPPSVAQIEEAITHLSQACSMSPAAMPTAVAGQPAYTARVSPKEAGSLIGGAELSFDANNGIPLRTAIYSSTTARR